MSSAKGGRGGAPMSGRGGGRGGRPRGERACVIKNPSTFASTRGAAEPKPPPPPPPSIASELARLSLRGKQQAQHGIAEQLADGGFAAALLQGADDATDEPAQRGKGKGKGRGGRSGRGGRGGGGGGSGGGGERGERPDRFSDAMPVAAAAATPGDHASSAGEQPVPVAAMVQDAIDSVERKMTLQEAEEAEAAARAKQERKERKKARLKEAKQAMGGAVLPVEPPLEIDGSIELGAATLSDFATLCRLGQGGFGRVVLARWRGDGRACAMKVVRLSEVQSASMAAQLDAERRVLTELARRPHPLLASALVCFESARHLLLVMPFLQGGTLARLVGAQPTQTLPEGHARFYVAQLLLALGALHERQMLYLDLKLENVVLSAAGDATLVDFGFVRCGVDVAAGGTAKRAGGTRVYLAPEAVQGQPVSGATDYWALGVLAYELLVGYLPFQGKDDKAINAAICNARVRFPSRQRHGADGDDGDDDEGAPEAAPAASTLTASAPTASAPAPAAAPAADAPPADGAPAASAPLSNEAVALVRKLLAKKAEARLGSTGGEAEVRHHPWLRSLDWAALSDGTLPRPWVPTLASDVDVRYFDRKHTSSASPLSAAEASAAEESLKLEQVIAEKQEKEALAAERAREERALAAAREAQTKANLEAHLAAKAKAVEDARAAEVQAAVDDVEAAQKKVRNAQKKLRQIAELQELRAGGGKLNSEQKAKVATLPALKMELDELLEDVASAEAEVVAVQARQEEERRQEERRRDQEAKKRGAAAAPPSKKDKK